MSSGFYFRMAASNIRKNPRLYVPRILAETGLVSCFYILFSLAQDERLSMVKGGSAIPIFMTIGAVVVGLLSVILILYANSFLMKQRKHEYGLYNVLGMEKRHIVRVLGLEALVASSISIVAGLGLGVLMYKLCSLLICKIMDVGVIAGFYYIRLSTILIPFLIFVAFDLFAFLVNTISVLRLKPVELLAQRHTGEKEPKVKWLLLVAGVVCLLTGYFISLTSEDPLETLQLFFLAVFLVIFGTYFLYIAGSVFVLKCLKHRKTYYYDKRHMISVSGLLFRMKQNAVGLASIAILSTGVLVMISSTVSLYSGVDDVVDTYYPMHAYFTAEYSEDDTDLYQSYSEEELGATVQTVADEMGVEIAEMYEVVDEEGVHKLGINFADYDQVRDLDGTFEQKVEEEFAFEHPYEECHNWCDFESKWEARTDLIGLYGSFFFLGVLLGFVCLFSTILIIYYKQISEGYEDRERFQIMQKIGMEQKEVKKTIGNQLTLTFFLPLVTAGVHTLFAYPIILRMLQKLLLKNTSLFMICLLITYAVFAIVYTIVYLLTARSYYKIVH